MKTRMKEIAEEIVQHYKNNPTHGVGCACLDKYSQELRSEFQVTPYWLHEEPPEVEKGGRAMGAVLHMAWRNLYHYQASKCNCPEDFYEDYKRTNVCLIHGINKNADEDTSAP